MMSQEEAREIADVGALIRASRAWRRLTQVALAGELGIDRYRLSRIEKGEVGSVRIADVFAIERVLGIPAEAWRLSVCPEMRHLRREEPAADR